MYKNNPLITVYIPTFNRLTLLKRAVNSVLNQTISDIEIIIVDDNSSDGTKNYLHNLSLQDKRVRYYIKDSNGGACESRNIAIEMALGKYITGLDDDDFFCANRLEVFLNFSHRLKTEQLLCANNLYKKSRGLKKTRTAFIQLQGTYTFNDLLHTNYIGNQIFTYTERLKSFSFNKDIPMWQDLDLWLRMTYRNRGFFYINQCTYVIDNEHGGERISDKKVKSLHEAYDTISNYYCLDEKQKKMLSLHYLNYGQPFKQGAIGAMWRQRLDIFTLARGVKLFINKMKHKTVDKRSA